MLISTPGLFFSPHNFRHDMSESAYSSLPNGIADIDQIVSDQVNTDSISPTSLGGVLRRILRTVYDVSVDSGNSCNSCWLVGEGNPSSEVGSEGDFYLNVLTGEIFENTGVGDQAVPDAISIDTDVITDEDLENFYTGWTSTGLTIQGPAGSTGPAGTPGVNGADGASVDIRLNGTQLQTKLTSEPSTSYSTVFDFNTVEPVLSVTTDRVLKYKLSGKPDASAVSLYDFSTLAPVIRVDNTNLQWKLAVQPLGDYQTIFNIGSITPVLRISGGQIQYKYSTQPDSAYVNLGAVTPVSALVGSQLPIDVAFTNIVPDVTPASVSTPGELGAILKGVDNALSSARLKMRSVTLNSAMVTARSVDFAVALVDSANANVVLDGQFIDPSTVSINSSGVMTWASGGTFDGAVTSTSRVILFSS